MVKFPKAVILYVRGVRRIKMDREEYETELKDLYGRAMKSDDIRLAFDILRAGRDIGLSNMRPKVSVSPRPKPTKIR